MGSDAGLPHTGPVLTAEQLGLMQGSPPAADKLVTLENWQRAPWNRWSFQHICQIIPCARVGRGDGLVSELPRDPVGLDDVTFRTTGGARCHLQEFLSRTCTDGFMVLRAGRVVTEQYFNGMTPHSRHLLQSVSKSITGALAGVLAGRGLLKVDTTASCYVPELRGGAFEGATVRHVLDMTAGTRFSEDYADPDSDVRLYESAAGWRPQSEGSSSDLDLFSYILTLENHRSHGVAFEYRSILTDLLGWIIERAGRRRFAELLSSEVWAVIGAEHDAEITVDRHGNPMTDGGISTTLRDLARFGLMYLRRGYWNDRQVVPGSWVDDTRFADSICRHAFARSENAERYPEGHYRNQWWVPDPQAGVLLAAGIYGQFVYLDFSRDVVIVKLSTLPVALDLAVSADHRRAFAAVAQAVS